MDKIDSFKVDHNNLNPGIYVSRKDYLNESTVLTTFDIRLTKPNKEPAIESGALHAIEHLGATFLRNNEKIKNKVIYFGPMGCRTGFYLILNENLESKDIVYLIRDLFEFILKFKSEIPGATPKECGNYLDMNLNMAKYYSNIFIDKTLKNIENKNLIYPK